MTRPVSLVFFLLFSLQSLAETPRVFTAVSPANRVALLELYTSEGCSSCPPVDRFMSRLKHAGISDQKLIPLSFHVTYWDYIGWKDSFGNTQYDERQRKQARLNASRTVYTPQLMMNGSDYRRYSSFYIDIDRVNAQAAAYQLELTATAQADSISVELNARGLQANNDKAIAYVAVYEHNLSSEVADGENEGERLHHDYVVRELKGPYFIDQYPAKLTVSFTSGDYQIENSGLVAFIQKPMSSEVLQTVRLELVQ